MELLTANVELRTRSVMEDGREFLVAPVSIINPGVLAGSKGALYYSPEATAAATEAWDRIPITLGHPVDNSGKHLSASSPGVLKSKGLGEVRSPRFDTKLRAEAWIDVEKTEKVAPSLLPLLRNNRPVAVSSGLFTENILVAAALDPRTKQEYTLEARNHVPDHLALLVDTRGACHLEHGCGVLVNEGKCDCGGECDECSPRNGGLTPNLARAFAEYVRRADEYSSSGLRVWVNEKAQTVLIDIMDWGDEKLAKATVGKVAGRLGGDRVTWQNEGGNPEGKGWVEIEPKRGESMHAAKHVPLDEPATNSETPQSIVGRFLNWLTTNALPNQPRSKVTGYYKQPNAGTGKGEVHTAAQQGNLTITADDEALGCDARKQKYEQGENPSTRDVQYSPSWCADEGKWERAKTAAGAEEDSDSYWARVTSIYKRMGGGIKKVGAVHNRDWSQEKRDNLDEKDFAGPHQSFPITSQADVDAAAHLLGKADDPEAVKARIIAIAKRRGLSVPEGWRTENDSCEDSRGDGGATMGGGVATPLPLAPLLLVNSALGYDAAFASDDLRLEALAGMVGNTDEEEVFQSDEQRNAFFGHLRAAGITPKGEKGKAKEGSGGNGKLLESRVGKTKPEPSKERPTTPSRASQINSKSTEAEIHKWFKEIKTSGTAAQAREFLDKVDGWKGTSYVQAIAHDHDVPIKKDPFFGKSKELASPEELRDRIIARAFAKGSGTRNQNLSSATAAVASLSANSEEDHLNVSVLHRDAADLSHEAGDYQRAEDHSRLAAEHATYAGMLAANAFCATGEGGGIDPSCSPGGSQTTSKGTSRTRKSPPLVHIEAPAEKVARITAALAEAKQRVAALAAELKAAKVDMVAAKKSVKKEVSARAAKAAANVESVAAELRRMEEKWLAQAKKDEARTRKTDKYGIPEFTGPKSEEMVAEVDRLAGTVSVHALAKALGIQAKAKNKEAALVKIRDKVLGRVGAFMRANA